MTPKLFDVNDPLPEVTAEKTGNPALLYGAVPLVFRMPKVDCVKVTASVC